MNNKYFLVAEFWREFTADNKFQFQSRWIKLYERNIRNLFVLNILFRVCNDIRILD